MTFLTAAIVLAASGFAKNLEKLAKPDAAKTIAAVKKVMYLE